MWGAHYFAKPKEKKKKLKIEEKSSQYLLRNHFDFSWRIRLGFFLSHSLYFLMFSDMEILSRMPLLKVWLEKELLLAKRQLKAVALGELGGSYTSVGDTEAAFLGAVSATVHRSPGAPVGGSAGDVVQLVGCCVLGGLIPLLREGPWEDTGWTLLAPALQQDCAMGLGQYRSALCRRNKRV